MNARDDVKEEIKSRLDIEDIVGRYVDLKRSGASFKGLCPFHQEKTPSFYVTPRLGTYKCFGCGRGGDIFSFVMEMEHEPFPDALKRLAEQANVPLPERQPSKPSLKGRLFEANEAALRFYREALRSDEGKRASSYLFERGFGDDAVDRFDLGYAPRAGESLLRHLRGLGFDDRLLLSAGLASQRGDGGALRDQFYGRLMFPIKDGSGKVLGFGGRVVGDGLPKYVNSPQTETFDKSSVLFGIQRAAGPIKDAGKAVLVEGYLDAIRAHLAGFENTVASLGTAITPQQLRALSRQTEVVVLALDPDSAGQNAAARTSLSALFEVTQKLAGSSRRDVDLRIAQLPAGHGDPDELIAEHPGLWQQAIDASIPALQFYVERTLASLDRGNDTWRERAIETLLPVIRQLPSPVQQGTWIQRISGEVGVDVQQLIRAMPTGGRNVRRSRPARPADDSVARTTARALATDPVTGLERALVAFLLQLLVVPADAAQELADAVLSLPEHRAIVELLLTWQNYDYEPFRDRLPEEARTVADELRALRVPLPPEGKVSIAVHLYLARLKQVRVQSQLTEARQHLQEMAPADQARVLADLRKLTEQKHEADQELRRLHQAALKAGSFIP